MSEPGSSESNFQRPLVIRSVFRTDVGLVRTENQDFGSCTTPQEERRRSDSGRLLIVADGMGGHRGGATASRLATETVKARYLESEADVPTALRESLAAANARIFHEAQLNPELRGMGTTTTALAVSKGKGWIAHVGDSRIYLVRDQEIRQLTADHSLVATMMREGLLTPEEAETHPRRNVLQRSMGVALEVEVDLEGPIDLRDGDTFVLCSDGLHGVVKEDEIREISARAEISAIADELLKRALDRGAPDNVTVIVARVEPDDGSVDLMDETLREEPEPPAAPAPVNPYDETQPLGALIQGREPADRPAAVAPDAETGEQKEATADPEPPPRPRSLFRWILLAGLILGAAGAWLYWGSNPAPVPLSHSSSR